MAIMVRKRRNRYILPPQYAGVMSFYEDVKIGLQIDPKIIFIIVGVLAAIYILFYIFIA